MEIYVDAQGRRVSGFGQPYISQQEDWRNVRLYNPNGSPPSEGLYDSPTCGCGGPVNRGTRPQAGCGRFRDGSARAPGCGEGVAHPYGSSRPVCGCFSDGFNRELSKNPRPPIKRWGC